MAQNTAAFRQKIQRYYRATTEKGYLASWSGETLALHIGLAGAGIGAHEDSLVETNRVLAEAARISPGERVLDAGCGVGGSAFWLAEVRHAFVVGISIAANQIALARRFAAEHRQEGRVAFAHMDFMQMGFRAGAFDVVWNLESLSHSPDPRAYLLEVKRVLRPGGRFACIDIFRGDGDDDGFARMCEGMALGQVRARDEIAAYLRETGFVDVRDDDLTERARASAERMREMARRRLALIRIERALRGSTDEIYESHTRAALAASSGLLGGSVTYGYVGGTAPRRD